MNKAGRRVPTGVWAIIGLFGFFVSFWIIGQGGAIAAYDCVSEFGLHPGRDQVDPITILVTQGIAVADVLIQLPFFIVAILGLQRLKFCGAVAA